LAIYELAFLVDPRLTDDEFVELSDGYKGLLGSLGAEVTKEESWGNRRLAYPIQKLSEARYMFFTVETDGNPWPEVERRMRQNDKVLRFLTVRLDQGRLRLRERSGGSAAASPPTTRGEEASP
jgi:small subunit ribosomal protein S6